MAEDNSDRATMAMELAKRQLIDVMWKTANIEVDGITFPDTQEIFDGRAPADMTVNDIIVVNNIKRAWMFLFENGGHPIDWQYVSEYNRILGEGLIRDAGKIRTNDVRIGGTDWIPDLPTIESSHDVILSLSKSERSAEDQALLMFCAITRGQWFNDGNKRTALMAARTPPARWQISRFTSSKPSKFAFASDEKSIRQPTTSFARCYPNGVVLL